MKITDVTLTLFAWDDIPPTQYGQHSRFAGSSALGLLRIATDDGVEGHAFLGSASNSATTDGQGLITHLKPVLMGRNPLHREALVVDLWKKQRACGVRAIGAVDVALWDLLGKAVGQPIHRLLGTYREAVPAYASSAVLASPAAYAEEAQKFKEHGWAAYKIHPPTRWKEDIKVCEAVRKAVGDYTIMLDSTWSYDYPTAVRVGRAAEEMGFHWYEDPAGRPGHLQLREAEAAALDPDSRHRISHYRPRCLPALDHAAGHRLPARRCRGQRRHHDLGEGRPSRRVVSHEL